MFLRTRLPDTIASSSGASRNVGPGMVQDATKTVTNAQLIGFAVRILGLLRTGTYDVGLRTDRIDRRCQVAGNRLKVAGVAALNLRA